MPSEPALLAHLIAVEKVDSDDIAVLIADAIQKDSYYSLLGGTILPGRAILCREDHVGRGLVLMETVNRFKGLEVAVVVLWGGRPPRGRLGSRNPPCRDLQGQVEALPGRHA